jgi:perosamine synthetase
MEGVVNSRSTQGWASEGAGKPLPVADEMILTAGPSITELEIRYVTDAVTNGWNRHHSDYIVKFETSFCSYVGVSQAMSTSSCTGALHLALLALGVGPGDEVIVPELTWIATAAAVRYVGATPIFCDVEPDTWVIDVGSVERCLSPRTKVIMPVDLYGQPTNMPALRRLADAKGLRLVEDAAAAIGASFQGHRTGSLADIACFSFQGAKVMVTGEGGMLVTDSPELRAKAWFFNDHGRDSQRPLWNVAIGYKYKMSNLQGALGLAQLERVEELIAKKRQLFAWYRERLSDVPGLQLNVEPKETYNSCWMSCIVLPEGYPLAADDFRVKLKERNIDTRPFFAPLSSMPMFENRSAQNPAAYSVFPRGINLPSGHNLTEQQVDYISAHVRDLFEANGGAR